MQSIQYPPVTCFLRTDSARISRLRKLSRLILFVAGAAVAAAGSHCGNRPTAPSESTAPAPPPAPQNLFYTAIGASDAVGIGASVPCLPILACPTGTGYVPLIARQLAGALTNVTLENLGIPGAVIGPDIQRLGASVGRIIPANFLQHELPLARVGANIVTIYAGGNDTNTIGAALSAGAGGADPNGFVDAQIRAFGDDYAALIAGVRLKSPSARIVVANLPNFAAMPFTAGYTPTQKLFIQRISVGIDTRVINTLVMQGVAVVDLLCDPRAYDPANYSSDGFHPNDAGYAILATEMLNAIRSAGYPAPSPTCPAMSVLRTD